MHLSDRYRHPFHSHNPMPSLSFKFSNLGQPSHRASFEIETLTQPYTTNFSRSHKGMTTMSTCRLSFPRTAFQPITSQPPNDSPCASKTAHYHIMTKSFTGVAGAAAEVGGGGVCGARVATSSLASERCRDERTALGCSFEAPCERKMAPRPE